MAELIDDCVTYYGFARSPFGATPSRRVLSAGRSFADTLAGVAQALRQHEGVIVVTGESGLGKTALCRAVLDDLVPKHVSIVTDPFLAVDDLLKQILNDFLDAADEPGGAVAPETSRQDLLALLQRFLRSNHDDALAVVMIDDAHHLRPETLECLGMLSNVTGSAGKKLQILLAGQPTLEKVLGRSELSDVGQQVSRSYRLRALSADEVERHVSLRLDAATERERTGCAPFSRDAVAGLARLSRGIPRAVNQIANEALDAGFARHLETITPDVIRTSARNVGVPVPLLERLPRTAMPAAAVVMIVAVTGAATILRRHPAVVPPPVGSERTPPPSPAASDARQSGPSGEGSGASQADIANARPARPEMLAIADGYITVAAAFKVEPSAQAFASKLVAAGQPAFVRGDATGHWYSVLVGPFASDEEARVCQQQLRTKFGLTDTTIKIERP